LSLGARFEAGHLIFETEVPAVLAHAHPGHN
jgi:hypothetical protein